MTKRLKKKPAPGKLPNVCPADTIISENVMITANIYRDVVSKHAEEFNTLRKELQGKRKELEKLTSVLAELDLQANFNTNLASATSTPNLYLAVLDDDSCLQDVVLPRGDLAACDGRLVVRGVRFERRPGKPTKHEASNGAIGVDSDVNFMVSESSKRAGNSRHVS